MLTLQLQINLPRRGQPHLLGAADDGTCWVEVFYDNQWAAHYILTADGAIAHTTDENDGRARLVALPFTAPPLPDPPANPFPALAYDTHAPTHGDRAADHIDHLCYPLAIPDKMQIVDTLRLDVPAPALIGLSRSRVLGVAALPDGTALVARELAFPAARLAPQPGHTYTTHTRHVLQRVPPADNPLDLRGLVRAEGLRAPLGCAWAGGRLVVVDAGDPCRVLYYSLDA